MVVNILGIIYDTQIRAANIPSNPDLVITVPQGGDATVRMRLVYASGGIVPKTKIKAASVVLTAKQRILGAPKNLELTATFDVDTQSWQFLVPAAKTKNMTFGRYVYDVWVTLLNGELESREQVVPASAFIILASEQVSQ